MIDHSALLGVCLVVAAASPLGACSKAQDVHDTSEVRAQACVSCHRSAYTTVTNPKHVDAFPDTCNTCHNTSAWRPATVTDHHWFALDGKHAVTACAGCHTGDPPRYAGTPTVCVGCHLADYQGSKYPGHATFPQTCADCHTTSAWTGAVGGNHPEAKFPIKTGSHANPGMVCTDCHDATRGSPIAGQNTDCIHCHLGAHNMPAIDATHVALGASYPGPNAAAPNFCLGCHPTG